MPEGTGGAPQGQPGTLALGFLTLNICLWCALTFYFGITLYLPKSYTNSTEFLCTIPQAPQAFLRNYGTSVRTAR